MSSVIQTLDHGFVHLVDYMGSDLAISRAARVSYNAPPREEDEKLIAYLMNNHHTSPFEAVVFTFEIKAPIFVVRQWHRHRTWSYNEVSARYTELPEEYYIPSRENVGKQSKHNKQVRDITGQFTSIDFLFCQDLQRHSEQGFLLYKKYLAEGVPRELARCFLGLNTYTRFFATVDLHNLFHFIRLRMDAHSQWEIQQYGKALLNLIQPICPAAVEAFLPHYHMV